MLDISPTFDRAAALIGPTLLRWGGAVLGSLAILFAGRWLTNHLAGVLAQAVLRYQDDETLAGFVRSGASALGTTLVVLAAIRNLGVPTNSLLALLGSAGLAVALALKGSLADLSAGIMLLIRRPISAGEFVKVGDMLGTVRKINLFQTELRAIDGLWVLVPNEQILSDTVYNYSRSQVRRVEVMVGVGYAADLGAACDALMAALRADDRVLEDPEPFVKVWNLGASSVDIKVHAWVPAETYMEARGDLTRALKEAMDEAGVDIPFPQRTLHLAPGAHEALGRGGDDDDPRASSSGGWEAERHEAEAEERDSDEDVDEAAAAYQAANA